MKHIFPIAVAMFVGASPVWSDGAVNVPLPQIPEFDSGETEHLLMQLVVANVIGQNCDGFMSSDAEWALLVGSADILAGRLGLDPAAYDERFYHPAFSLLGKENSCAREGPNIAPLVERLIGWGGSLEIVP